MFARAFVLLCVFLSATVFASAQTTIHVPADQPTIQVGIDAANAGDTVLVAPGTYKETIDFKGKAITVTSAAGAATTIIDATGIAGPAARFTNGEPRSATLNGFTVLQGGSNPGEPSATGPQGGIYVSASSPTVSNNVLTQSHCYGIDSQEASPLIQGNEIDNTLNSYQECISSAGAAISTFDSLGYFDGPGNPDTPPIVITGNTLQNNTQSAGGEEGAAISAWGGSIVVEQNVIRNNVTLGYGAIYVLSSVPVTIVGNLVYGNTAAQVTAGIYIQGTSGAGGGFFGILANNTVFGNTLSSGEGYSSLNEIGSQAFLTGDFTEYVLVNNLVVGNSSYPALNCDVLYSYLSYTPLVFDHNDIYNAGAGPTYSGVCPDQTGTYGNISADPRFVSPSSGDFHLQPGSPAIDTGNNSAPNMLPTDIGGAARIQDATDLGYPVIDMGAYEAPGNTELPATTLTLTPSTYTPQYNPFSLTATLAAGAKVPTGPVTFFMDMNSMGTVQADATGSATLQRAIPAGLHAFLATYPGQGTFPPAVSVKFYVLFPEPAPALTLSSSVNPSQLGQPVTFTVHISSPDGSIPGPITLSDSASFAPPATLNPDSTGTATFTTSTLAAGTHQITASFAGSNTDGPASATLSQQVLSGTPTSTSLICTPLTISLGATSSLVAAASSATGTPTGALTLSDNTATLAQLALANGSATYTYTGVSAGSHTLTATFAATATLAGSSASCTVDVVGLPSLAALSVAPTSSSFGSPVTLTAKVSAIKAFGSTQPTGAVTFLNGSTALGTVPLAAGLATLTLNTLPGGADPLSCTYSGDTLFAPSNCNTVPVTVAAAPTTLTLTSSANPSVVSSPPLFTLHLTESGQPAPAGTAITLEIGPNASFPLTTDATGSATLTAPTLLPGSYPVTASFGGNNNLLPSSASLTQVITGYQTATSLSTAPNPAYQGQTVTLSASIHFAASGSAPAPPLTGSVIFYDGSNVLGTVPLSTSGPTTLTTSSLSPGTHPISATFATSGAFVGSTSAVVQQSILPSTFTIALNPTTLTLHAGQTGAVSVSLASIGIFTGPLSLSYGALPAYATAAFSPASVTLSPAATASSTLSLNTAQDPGTATAQVRRPGRMPLIAFATLLVPLGLFRSRRRLVRMHKPSILLVLAIFCHLLTGCGTVGFPFHLVAPGTYQIPITATDAAHHQQTAILTVTVAP